MTPELARSYGRLLRIYPKSWRAENESELLGTLDETATAEQTRPTFRETRSLFANGMRARVRASNADRASAMAEGVMWGVMAALGIDVILLLASLWQRIYPSQHMKVRWEISVALDVCLFLSLIVRPRRSTCILWAVTSGCVLAYDAWGLLTRPHTNQQLPRLGASILVTSLMAIALLWSIRRLPTKRRSYIWLCWPLVAGLLPIGFGSLMILAAILLMLLGPLGGARLDPRLPVAGATLAASIWANDAIIVLLEGLTSPAHSLKTNDWLAFTLRFGIPFSVTAICVALIRRHARIIFSA